jgi:hypothetical protein
MPLKARYLLLAFLAATSAEAFATQVTLDNRSGRRLCTAVAATHQESNGPESEISGFTCVESGQTLALESFDGAVFLAVVDATGADYVATKPDGFPLARSWVAGPAVKDFGLDVIQFDAGGYSYSYYLGDEDWSHWHPVGGEDDLNTLLKARGFRPVKGWILDAATLGAAATIRLAR